MNQEQYLDIINQLVKGNDAKTIAEIEGVTVEEVIAVASQHADEVEAARTNLSQFK